MRLYCQPCGDLHKLTGAEVERITYTLQHMLSNAELALALGPGEPKVVFCLLRVQQLSYEDKYRPQVDRLSMERIGRGGGL